MVWQLWPAAQRGLDPAVSPAKSHEAMGTYGEPKEKPQDEKEGEAHIWPSGVLAAVRDQGTPCKDLGCPQGCCSFILWLGPLPSWFVNSRGCSFSCYEVNLRGCLLQDLLVSFSQPPGSREEQSFTCRLGEIQVVDANSLLAPLPRVQNVTISQLRWLPLISGSEGVPPRLLLSCTLHWSYLLLQARCFRIHCLERTGSSPATEEKPAFLGLAFANQYRVVDLAVEAARFGQDGRVEFLVEPVPREGFLVPQAEWGRAVLLYSAPQ